jgi:hypothetical protein
MVAKPEINVTPVHKRRPGKFQGQWVGVNKCPSRTYSIPDFAVHQCVTDSTTLEEWLATQKLSQQLPGRVVGLA